MWKAAFLTSGHMCFKLKFKFTGSNHQNDDHKETLFAAIGSQANMYDNTDSSSETSSQSSHVNSSHREAAISLDDIQLVDISPCDGYKNQYNLKVGSVIQYDNPPRHGVIKWLGHLPNEEIVMYAGVEMVMYGKHFKHLQYVRIYYRGLTLTIIN